MSQNESEITRVEADLIVKSSAVQLKANAWS